MSVHTEQYKGFTIDIETDDDASNPLKEFDGEPVLVLHRQAESNFAWTNDRDRKWFERINGALDRLADRASQRLDRDNKLYGSTGALAIIERWLHAYWGVGMVLGVGAMEHSGTTVYCYQGWGKGTGFGDSDGWDSGWIGWFFWAPELRTDWPEADQHLEDAFDTFKSWVEGDVYGWTVTSPQGALVESCWGYYGSAEWVWEDPDVVPNMIQCARDVIDDEAAGADQDEAEIEEMRLAEVGA